MAGTHLIHALFRQNHGKEIMIEGDKLPQQYVECPIGSEFFEFEENLFLNDQGTKIKLVPGFNCRNCFDCGFEELQTYILRPNLYRGYDIYIECSECNKRVKLNENIEYGASTSIIICNWNYNCICGNKENGILKLSIVKQDNNSERNNIKNNEIQTQISDFIDE